MAVNYFCGIIGGIFCFKNGSIRKPMQRESRCRICGANGSVTESFPGKSRSNLVINWKMRIFSSAFQAWEDD
jgi:hypothetical protein